MRILLEAPILTKSGYGEHARFVFRSLMSRAQHHNLEIFINPLNWGETGWITRDSDEKRLIEENIKKYANYVRSKNEGMPQKNFDIQIHVGIPNEFEKKAAYSICVTAGIETDRVDPKWLIKTHEGIDKIIVPSHHSKNVFEQSNYQVIKQDSQESLLSCKSDVKVVPYPVKKVESKSLDFAMDTEFNFLSIALMGVRKNIPNMLKWFVEEFRNDNVGLVIKTGYKNGSLIDRKNMENLLKDVVGSDENRKCKVFLLHGHLTEKELSSLYQREDIHVYVTTTHGEGYGLPIFDAVCNGMPVVATNWSGHLDFLKPNDLKTDDKNPSYFLEVDYEMAKIQPEAAWKEIIHEESQWAYVKPTSFKKQIRNAYNNYEKYKKTAKVLQDHILVNHEQEKITNLMFDNLLGDLIKQNEVSDDEVVVF
tara:strand:+ start:1388 stop:2653 length:1266 start_codon:yes stop_codon:yes gene_type:complete